MPCIFLQELLMILEAFSSTELNNDAVNVCTHSCILQRSYKQTQKHSILKHKCTKCKTIQVIQANLTTKINIRGRKKGK